jgi:RimJ/RimL family protein N-acetyltransferase
MHGAARLAIEAPLLETQRLRLRGHRLDDLDACCAMWGDPIVTRYIGGKPFTREEVWARLLRYIGHWSLLGFGYWAVEEKASGTFVGEMGFGDFKRELEPPLDDTPELGWALASQAHGKGYATEALRAVIDWGDHHFGAIRTACLIHPENLASMRVAEKCGYHEYARATYKGHETILFER